MKHNSFTTNEKKVLCGLATYPYDNDSIIAEKIGVKLSTFTSIKRRLEDQKYFRYLLVPNINLLGCELLAVIYTQFNPVIPLKERVNTTKETIEVFDEIFFSVGVAEKGFSISLSQNYSNIGRINEIRTETFGKVGLLDKEYPNEVIFPFDTSNINRFFEFNHLLHTFFFPEKNPQTPPDKPWFTGRQHLKLTPKEKIVYVQLIQHPTATTEELGNKVGVSRHTISRMKKKFYDLNLLRPLLIPDLNKLGFELLAFYHLKFNPHNAPTAQDITYLNTPSTIFLAHRQFELILIAAYPTYQTYQEDKMKKIRYLKENELITYTPLVRKYIFDRMEIIKDFTFAPLAKKTVELS